MKAALIEQYRITKTSIEERLKELQSANVKIVEEKKELQGQIDSLKKELTSKQEQLMQINDKIDDMKKHSSTL